MMRALRILESAPTLGIVRDFQDNLLPVSRVRRHEQVDSNEPSKRHVSANCAPRAICHRRRRGCSVRPSRVLLSKRGQLLPRLVAPA